MREAFLLARFAETVDFDQMLFDDNSWEIELDPFSCKFYVVYCLLSTAQKSNFVNSGMHQGRNVCERR